MNRGDSMLQSFKVALNNGGAKAGLIYIISSGLLLVMFLVIMTLFSGGSLFSIVAPGNLESITNHLVSQIMSTESYGIVLALLGILFVFGIVSCGILLGGLIGSFRDVVEGRPISIASYFNNSLHYALRTIGYICLYFFIFGLLVGIIFTLIYMIFLIEINNQTFLISLLSGLVITPLLTLSIVGYKKRGFITQNIGSIFIYSLAIAIFSIIPVIGQIVTFILQTYYHLFILVISTKNNNTFNFTKNFTVE